MRVRYQLSVIQRTFQFGIPNHFGVKLTVIVVDFRLLNLSISISLSVLPTSAFPFFVLGVQR